MIMLSVLLMSLSGADGAQFPDADRARALAELHPCDARAAQKLVGRVANPRLIARALRLRGAAQARLVRPGQPISMDYATDRITIEVDARDRVIRLSCG
jgi:hypothetical protein